MYQISMQNDGGILEAIRDSIKQFDTIPPYIDDTESAAIKNIDDSTNHAGEDTTTDTQTNMSADSQTLEAESLDFDALWDINPEICAWIEIDGTKIDYPVLQSKDSDKKYLTTAYDGSPYIGGAIFTEATYNNADFADPVTVIYGHTMRSGTLFGQLQKTYSVSESFEKHGDIKIYLPGGVRHYTVFAAVPYSGVHLLGTYDFSDTDQYNKFFADISSIQESGANIREDIRPQVDDRVIILSTSLNEDTTRKYLVMAVLEDDLADNT